MDRVYKDLEDRAYEELKTLCKKSDISPAEWEVVEKIVCILHKIYEMDETVPMEDERLYSNQRMSRHSNGYRDGMYITPAMDHHRNSYDYIYDDYQNRYSRHSIKDRAIDRLERMLDESKSESEKESVRKMIGVLEHTELY